MNFKNLTSEERIVANFINKAFEERNQNMISTIVWINNHTNYLVNQRPDVHRAMKNLTNKQFNHVISEILLPF
ncbi:hypothetical protein GBP40_03660 [Pediococcus acidilactici]|uniref:hypothetical protein n=1 Tax=Pediococcus acidilactici TaxID=1254 RepID=UPI0013285CF8|nr:hypothetical protein [Pediococcus acidilactici]KAF0470493.1 hypothetical protein GBP06_03665 [Pediococcus acidilactici]KAF0542215.1 hypothetical protein GBP40_03660 [Pediococcus acidilactici]